MRKLIFDAALLPSGWASDVAVDCSGGMIAKVAANASSDGRERIRGVALPGLPNLHSHTFQRGMAGRAEIRGTEEDSFWTWRQAMYRFLGRLTPDDVEAVAAFAMMEMLEGGFTALAEFHYLHHDADGRPYANPAEMAGRIAAAAAETGLGLTLLPVLYAHGGFGGTAPNEGQRRFVNSLDGYFRLVEASRAALAGLDDATLGVAPHSLRAVTPDELGALLGAMPTGPVHMHIAEQVKEVADCLAWSGQRPVEWLLDHADVDDRWCLVHATHLTGAEIRRMAPAGAVAGLCPITEANLGDGLFEGHAYRAAGGRFGIGSDSNVQIDAPGELKLLEYGQRLNHGARNVLADPGGGSTGRALYEAALAGGAAALGRRIGALDAGYRADVVVLDTSQPDLCLGSGDSWLDRYIFVAGRSAIDSVIVAGRTVVTHGRHHKRDAIVRRTIAALARLAS
ncbi:formimidoylglutamate deiminase [Phreatobacter stygius]|uniref:Formimidoylglutamate deiminase n=1 Tax=Phreatobacter stygius TaxID=1940610 RepID=A0A4D7BGE1_9HYPH|nr:formimidoylglutamate deiminase [Phreatobacter stygius]QCI69463.1 formimidoylglutamate deiminase [Phreatobacter stygius]